MNEERLEYPPMAPLPQRTCTQDNSKDKILTGWRKLDDLLSGGIPRQEIIALAASNTTNEPPAVGSITELD